MSLPVRMNTRNGAKENQNRTKEAPQRTANTKRIALGNVTNQIRKQPQRIAKDKHSVFPSKQGFSGQENVHTTATFQQKASSGPGFSIFEDVAPGPSKAQTNQKNVHYLKEESLFDQENLLCQENFELVAGLNKNISHTHRSYRSLDLDEGSPMVIDNEKDKDASINRSDEYGLEHYDADIYQHMKAVEPESRPERTYMKKQSDVSTSMRNILCDWLVEVGEEYKLTRETLYLAINYVDRVLASVGVHRPKLQLLGTACMLIASKYEEIYPPDVAEFVYITDDTYNREQVLKMETVVLRILDYRFTVPTINWFIERFLDLVETTDKATSLTFFLAELSLIEIEEFLEFKASEIAASSIILARSTLHLEDVWPSKAERYSGYSLAGLKNCVLSLFRLYSRKSNMPQQAVIEKYKQSKFHGVSLISPPAALAIY